MKIKKITSQYRKDFCAVYECEHCGATETGHGYDDNNFYQNVIPNMQCEQCGKTAGNNVVEKPIPDPLYGCVICCENYSWPATNLFWSEKLKNWCCDNCWAEIDEHWTSDNEQIEHGISLADEIKQRGLAC